MMPIGVTVTFVPILVGEVDRDRVQILRLPMTRRNLFRGLHGCRVPPCVPPVHNAGAGSVPMFSALSCGNIYRDHYHIGLRRIEPLYPTCLLTRSSSYITSLLFMPLGIGNVGPIELWRIPRDFGPVRR